MKLALGLRNLRQIASGGGGGSSAVALVTTNGTRKHANVVLSNGNLSEHGNSGDGSFQIVSADTAKNGKRQFEMTVDTLGSGVGHCIGFDDGSTDFSVDIGTPGTSVTVGCVFAINGSGSYTIYKNGAGVGGGALTVAAGDIISTIFDKAAGTCGFYLTHSGSTSQIDVTQTGLSTSGSWTAFVGSQFDHSNTANFGASAFARTLDAGYSTYQT